MLAVFAGFERDLIRERVNAGLDAARAKGVQLGRPATAAGQADEVRALRAQGLSQRAIAGRLGIGNGSVARILAEEPAGAKSPAPEGKRPGPGMT
jgi:DNA invertase Pin-like site-specific DNA recombinase